MAGIWPRPLPVGGRLCASWRNRSTAPVPPRCRGVPSMPKILLVAGDATEDLEFFYPYQRLLEEGYDVDVAAPSRKKLSFVTHDFVEGYDTYTERQGHSWPA